jgi:site-specific DNA-methyltransferase (cytosine-N4-specific)
MAIRPVYTSKFGKMYLGDSSELLLSDSLSSYHGKAQLIFTSPPFPLNTKKRYGNLRGKEYVDWLAKFALLLRPFLKKNGSIVLEIGNAWEPQEPIVSTTVMRALLEFLDAGHYYLCQEFVWYNPAKLPSPAQWVNVERSRVKDAFTKIWWMSPVKRPKADNRRVLLPYSESMKRLIKNKKYNAGSRPSQHVIGKSSFYKDNGGAIPPNVFDGDSIPSLSSVLKATNTRSSDRYQNYCRANGLISHPARMPFELAEFFIKFLTEEGDLVVDPFAGSNTTGFAAENLGRKWLSLEKDAMHASVSIGRFSPNQIISRNDLTRVYRDQSSSSLEASPVRTS